MSSYRRSSSLFWMALSFTVSSFHFLPVPKLPPSVTLAVSYWRDAKAYFRTRPETAAPRIPFGFILRSFHDGVIP